MSNAEDQPRRRRGGAAREARVVGRLPDQRPWAQPTMRLNHTEVLSVDEIEAIHDASLIILRDIGIEFLDPEARGVLARGGCRVSDDNRVRFDPELVMETVRSAPSEFTVHSWNPAHNMRVGGRHMAFGTVASAPNSHGLGAGRRTGNQHDYQQFLRLAQAYNVIHFISGYPVEPIDIHASVRHIQATYDALTLTDKALHAYSLGRQRNIDCLEMVRIARGRTEDQIDNEPSLFTVINSNSPLRLDTPMTQGILEFSRRGQVVVLTPFTLAGAMAPITLAGALALQNAEALSGAVLTQLVRPGSPFVYGGFTSNVDMQSGAPAFGTPEYMKTAIAGGQLARRYGFPYRSSNVCAANAVDAQAAYESVFALWGAVMGGVNMLMHGAGWMEGGLHASFEKFALDCDLLTMVTAMLDPVVVNAETLALEAIAEVGPGGHFFGTAHTQARFRSEFHRPWISDWRNFETWEEAGSPQAAGRAGHVVGMMLDQYEQPVMNDAAKAELDDFVARRVAEGGVPTDF